VPFGNFVNDGIFHSDIAPIVGTKLS